MIMVVVVDALMLASMVVMLHMPPLTPLESNPSTAASLTLPNSSSNRLRAEPNHTTLAGHSYEHDLLVSSKYGFLGSIDSNTGDELLGWDT